MVSLILTNLKHFLITSLILLLVGVAVIVSIGGHIGLAESTLAYKIGNEGPHVFYQENGLMAETIRGGRDDGFYIEKHFVKTGDTLKTSVHFPLDGSEFDIEIADNFSTPETVYDDDQAIVAISDIEGNYRAFRDFLIAHDVVDTDLNWAFGRGHLVLVGDFVDRGSSTTQVLWLIYKLEQEARAAGGNVHFILGNHEIKNLQGNFQSAADKYFYVAGALGKPQYELFSDNSFLGRWMASKNTAERINGILFMHGGIHPDLSNMDYTLDDLNQIVRANYRKVFMPWREAGKENILMDTRNGPSWYRGYFKSDLSQAIVDAGLAKFEAKAIVVGHQPQWSVRALYDKKVFAIDVHHPDDYSGSFPTKSSEGLLISSDGKFMRLTEDGGRHTLN
ncbi:metallophosphoesterase [Kordiimonas sp. SCSIO 12610]|uniref:metallophosphoesterase n=1 Tax=Kordiimonas sp. SCSIO 12610 TaxID=2829597 RepID=UPI00210AF5FB|nr:metallophosphoesterase [Kordiimonas sp. SCSIO 12610]UTW53815.1 metallophosphoesterase [Kordiimonas sp. SCSIO 12610]